MADRFKIGEGFVSIDTEDDTPSGLARIKGTVDRWISGVEQKVRSGFASGFDEGADDAERRMAKFTREVTGELDRIAAKRTKIDVDILSAAEKIIKLRKEAETATVDRKLKITAEIAAAEADIKVLKREAEDLDGKKIELEAKLKNGPETALQIKELDKSANNWISTATGFAASFGRITSGLASFVSLLGPAINGIIGAVTATGEWLAGISPVAALLPGLAASVATLGLVAKATFPAIVESLSPIKTALTSLQTELGKTASQGVPALAEAFVKANFPAIEAGANRIATAINGVVQRVLEWSATAAGQQAVAKIMDAAAAAAERLGPSISALVISMGNFVARAGDPAIKALSGLLSELLDKTRAWIDGLTQADVESAFKKIEAAATLVVEKFNQLKEAVTWLSDHKKNIQDVSDALAGIGLVAGAASGNWVAAIGGAVTLILNHFDTVKKAASGVWEWISGVWKNITNDPWFQQIMADLQKLADGVGKDLMDGLKNVKSAFDEVSPSIKKFWDAMAPVVHEFLTDPKVKDGISNIALGLLYIGAALGGITLAAGGALATLGALGTLIGTWVTGTITDGIKNLFTSFQQFIDELSTNLAMTWINIQNDAQNAVNGVISFFEQLPARMSAVWQAVQDVTNTFMLNIQNLLGSLPTTVASYFDQMTTNIPAKVGELAGAVVGQFAQMVLSVAQAIATMPGNVASTFTQAKDSAVAIAQQMVSNAVSTVSQIPGQFMSVISPVIGNVTSILGQARDSAVNLAKQMVSNAVSTVTAMPGQFMSAISPVIANATSIFTQARDSVVNLAKQMVANAVSVVTQLPGKVAAALAGIGGALFSAGSELIGGFIRGIQSKIPDLSGVLNGITSKLPSWKGPAVRDATILEPSGKLVMAGFGRGIAAGANDIRRQLADVTATLGATVAAGAGASNTQPAGGPSYVFEAGSIVLDASNIRSLQDLLDMIGGIQSTARQHGAGARRSA